jgi:hypothetical protein
MSPKAQSPSAKDTTERSPCVRCCAIVSSVIAIIIIPC